MSAFLSFLFAKLSYRAFIANSRCCSSIDFSLNIILRSSGGFPETQLDQLEIIFLNDQ